MCVPEESRVRRPALITINIFLSLSKGRQAKSVAIGAYKTRLIRKAQQNQYFQYLSILNKFIIISMGNTESKDLKELVVASLNYSGELNNPFQYLSKPSQHRDAQDLLSGDAIDSKNSSSSEKGKNEAKNENLVKINKIALNYLFGEYQKQKNNSNNPKELTEKQKQASQPKDAREISFLENLRIKTNDFGDEDLKWQKERYSPLYMPECGIKDNIFLMGKKSFEQEWELWRKKKYPKQDEPSKQQLKLMKFDTMCYKILLIHVYFGQKHPDTFQKDFEASESLKLDASSYQVFMDKHFNQDYLKEQERVKVLLNNLDSQKIDIIFIQEAPPKLAWLIENKTDEFSIVKPSYSETHQNRNLILIREKKFPLFKSLQQENLRLFQNCVPLRDASTQPDYQKWTNFYKKYKDELEKKYLIQFVYNIILIAVDLPNCNKNDESTLKKIVYFFKNNFPSCSFIIGGTFKQGPQNFYESIFNIRDEGIEDSLKTKLRQEKYKNKQELEQIQKKRLQQQRKAKLQILQKQLQKELTVQKNRKLQQQRPILENKLQKEQKEVEKKKVELQQKFEKQLETFKKQLQSELTEYQYRLLEKLNLKIEQQKLENKLKKKLTKQQKYEAQIKLKKHFSERDQLKKQKEQVLKHKMTTFKERTFMQVQLSKSNVKIDGIKDYITSNLELTKYDVLEFKNDRPISQTQYLPKENHPFDHFLVKAVYKITEKLIHVSQDEYKFEFHPDQINETKKVIELIKQRNSRAS